ncbi:S8 family serine peptidase [Sporosarcina sp. NPDC096371]|uniref:S8 family serine peptidase n=1 Tax=Sporosarcina sp. NPDC096371 TaxID=3364530 RepID=UPI003809E440
MKNNNVNKYIAAMMATAMISVPAVDAFANDPVLDKEKALDLKDGGGISEATTNHVITLITGDVVTVTDIADGKNGISVENADGTDGGAQIMTLGENTFVIPAQAMPYLASGLLDENLFNITALIADGYDDEKQSTLPVIVQYAPTKARFEAALPATLAGSERTNVLESIGGVAVSADKEQATSFWEEITQNVTAASSQKAGVQLNGVIEKIWLDGRVEANLEKSVPQVKAPETWESGYDGTGVTVAVLDTGIDKDHPDLSGQLDEAVSFVPGEDSLDYHHHGTHVASTVLGTGAASDGRNKGVAPGARLLVGKVLANNGFGQESWVIEGMEWAAEHAKVVNMSLGDSIPSDGTDPMSQAVNEISKETGALFVIAAGNTGAEGIGAPGAAEAALTVGSVDKSDRLSWFSSRGSAISGLKPDLVAPGAGIVAARSQYSRQGSGSYLTLDGTSMATPHVAGAAAILVQRYPDWTAVQLKDALMSTTKKLDSIKPFEGGTGRLDVAAATLGTVRATGALDFGFFDWPHEGDVPVEKTVTYTNEGDEPVTLDLSSTFTDNSKSETPEGLLKLSANQVTVPAKGSAEVIVTVDPESAVIGNRYQGQLSAIVGGQTVAHTTLGMSKEDERYTLTINAVDRDGSPARTQVSLVGPNYYPGFMIVEGKKEVRLPAGTYSVMTLMDVDANTDQAGVALLGNPEVQLDGPKTVDLDARKAHEYTVDIPEENEASFTKLEYHRTFGGENAVTGGIMLPAKVDKLYAEPTMAVNTGDFYMSTRWRLIKPFMTVNHGETTLDVIAQAGSTLFEGKHELAAVYAGYGAARDYDGLDVKDKVVVVKRSTKITGPQRAAAAYAAGAKLVITVNDSPEEYIEWVGKEDRSADTPIAVVSVSGTEGEELIEAVRSGKVMLNVEGTPNSPYVYDLVDAHKNAVPEDLNYSPTENELVKIDTQYKSDRPAPGGEFRYDIQPYSTHAVGFLQKLALPSKRTEWVSTQGGVSWYHEANVLSENSNEKIWQVRDETVTYKPGQRMEQEWFAPVVRPRFGEGFWPPFRQGNNVQINVPAWADSGVGRTGIHTTKEQTMKLYQGSTLLREANGQALYVSNNSLPVENMQYRLVADVSRDAERWVTSVSTHTEWTFWSKARVDKKALPLISLDFKVATDMKGNAIAGNTIKLGLSTSQIAEASGNGKIEGASLEVSYNEGESWEKVNVVREGEGWTAEIHNPKKSGTFVSLRASAWDDEGNRIDQDIMKAFGVSDADPVVVDSAVIYALVERFEKEGEFKNAQAVRALKTHLKAVAQYEKQEAGDKVMKHMKGFKVLLDQQKESKLISDKAYNALMASTDEMIKNWK